MRERIDGSGYTPEPSLRQLGIVDPRQKIREITRILDTHGAEGWIYGYEVNVEGGIRLYVKEKCMLSIALPPQKKAEFHLQKFMELQKIGVPIPVTYGACNGALYQELIVKDGTREIYEKIGRADKLGKTEAQALEQLVDIAIRLDHAGYSAHGFVNDLIYDPERQKFFNIDAGFDLGMAGREPTEQSKSGLVEKFRRHETLILGLYTKKLLSLDR